jgi:hypothetical protein
LCFRHPISHCAFLEARKISLLGKKKFETQKKPLVANFSRFFFADFFRRLFLEIKIRFCEPRRKKADKTRWFFRASFPKGALQKN